MKAPLPILLVLMLVGCQQDKDEKTKPVVEVVPTTPPESEVKDWGTPAIEAKIERDDKRGQYLQLKHRVSDGWTIRIDLPEHWRIKRAGFESNDFAIETESNGTYAVNAFNRGPLAFDVHVGREPKTDQELETIWRKHAQRE